MEITQEQIIEAIKGKPDLVKGILPTIQTSESFTTLLNNRADVLYKEKIGDEVKKIHSQYDKDMFEILGEQPGVNEDGSKQKSYEKLKSLLVDYKSLREKKDSLTKDAELKALQDQIAKLKTEGGAKHVQEVFDQAKATWEQQKSDYESKITDANKANEDFQKKSVIAQALSGIKFNPDVSDTVRNVLVQQEEQRLLQNSKIENGKVIFLDSEGKVAIDPATHSPMDASQMISTSDVIKEISLKSDNNKGGGAQPEIKGSIVTTTVEGKDTKKLNIPQGSFKSRSEFIEVAEKALLDSGLTRRDPDWDKLKTAAYKELKVSELPVTA